MPATTFGHVWRKVRLRCPDAPPLLCQDWVMTAYRTLCDRRGWVWLVKPLQLAFAAHRPNLAVTVTPGSQTVTSAGLFLPSDEGRQFRVESYPIYTVDGYVDANTIGLAQPFYGVGTGAVTAEILDAYGILPLDFGRFVAVVDPTNQRMVPWWVTQEELDLLDPVRMAADAVPRLLCTIGPSTQQLTPGQLQVEYWPKPTAAGALQAYYISRPTTFAEDDVLTGVLQARSDILVTGALVEAALWPGTTQRPNPYFNISTRRLLQDQFDRACLQLELRDDDQSQQSWSVIPWDKWSAWAWAYDTHLLRETDATLGSYWGFSGALS